MQSCGVLVAMCETPGSEKAFIHYANIPDAGNNKRLILFENKNILKKRQATNILLTFFECSDIVELMQPN
jgi:hypothetical protein